MQATVDAHGVLRFNGTELNHRLRRDTGEDWREYFVRLMQEEGKIDAKHEPTDEEIRRFDKGRKNKKVSNDDWVSKTEPEARITQLKDGRTHPAKFFFSNLPTTTSLKRLVATAKSRWWIEHSYRELKDELGLNHFEGRSWRGWHHHVVLVLWAYVFLQDLRRRRIKKGALA